MAMSAAWVPETGCTDQCQEHEGCIVKFYCPSHDVFACGNCLVETHATCDTEYIPDVAKDYQKSEEFGKLKESIGNFERNLSTLGEDQFEKTIASVKEYRAEININLAEHEEELLSKLRKVREDKRKLQNVHKSDCSDCASMKVEITELKQTIDEKEQSNIEAFMSAKQQRKHISVLESRLAICEEKQKMPSYIFQKNPKILDSMTTNNNVIGSLKLVKQECATGHTRATERVLEYVTDIVPSAPPKVKSKHERELSMCIFTLGNYRYLINVRQSSRAFTCCIKGMDYLCNHRIVIADSDNKSIGLVDTDRRRVLSRLDVPTRPFDVAAISDDKVAVSLPFDKAIQIVSICHTNNSLHTVTTINVSGNCYGLAYGREKLVVSYLHPAKLEIMDIFGYVKNCINASQTGRIFEWPYYVTITDDVIGVDGEIIEAIYVSDSYRKTVTKLTLTGEVLFSYTDFVRFKGCTVEPMGIAPAGAGNILVCCKYSAENQIQLVSREGKKMRVLMDRDRSYRYHIQAICYLPGQTHEVCISVCGDSYDEQYNSIRVYRVSSP